VMLRCSVLLVKFMPRHNKMVRDSYGASLPRHSSRPATAATAAGNATGSIQCGARGKGHGNDSPQPLQRMPKIVRQR
jgi:hypothetical protein